MKIKADRIGELGKFGFRQVINDFIFAIDTGDNVYEIVINKATRVIDIVGELQGDDERYLCFSVDDRILTKFKDLIDMVEE